MQRRTLNIAIAANAGLGLLLSGMVVGSVASSANAEGASTPTARAATTVTACVNRKTRVMRQTTKCKKREFKVIWSGQGAVGPQGIQGPAGPQGAQGTQGVTGESGTQGGTGVGPQGATGSSGPQGETGPQGPEGPQGEAGLPGAQGEPGSPGLAGAQGPAGVPGSQGDAGISAAYQLLTESRMTIGSSFDGTEIASFTVPETGSYVINASFTIKRISGQYAKCWLTYDGLSSNASNLVLNSESIPLAAHILDARQIASGTVVRTVCSGQTETAHLENSRAVLMRVGTLG